jgi:hypothetical protein
MGYKLVHWLYQVLVEIEVVVSHFCWQNQERLPSALLVQLLCVFEGDQGISLTVDYEGRA